MVRDPRDTALSKANFAFTDYVQSRNRHGERSPAEYVANRLPGSTITWVRHVGRHLQNRHDFQIHFVFFERLLHDTEAELERLLDYLEVPLDASQRAELTSRIAFDSMRRRDPEHVATGQSGKWRKQLTPPQQQQVLRLASQLLDRLNYPLNSSDQRLPDLPTSEITDAFIESAIAQSRGTVIDKLRLAISLFRSRRSFSQKLSKGLRFLMNRPVQ